MTGHRDESGFAGERRSDKKREPGASAMQKPMVDDAGVWADLLRREMARIVMEGRELPVVRNSDVERLVEKVRAKRL